MKRLLFFSIGVLCLAACSSASRKAIVQAERLLDSRPDSALLIMNRIDESSLFHHGLRARYALVLTASQVKNYLDIRNDSLISSAYRYYRRHGMTHDRLRSAYYWGVVLQNAGETIEPSLLFSEAEVLAERTKQYHYLGLSRQHLCALYADNYDAQAACNYAEKAVDAFETAGEPLSADFSRMDMARQLFHLGEIDHSIRIVDSLLTFRATMNSGLRYCLYVLKADLFYWNRNYSEAESYYELAREDGYSLDLASLSNLAFINEIKGRSADADSCLNLIRQQLNSPIDSAAFYDCESAILLHRGDVRGAYHLLEDATSTQNKIVSSLLARSITHLQSTYYAERYSSEMEQKWTVVLIAFLLVSFMLIIILAAFSLLKKRKVQILEEMEKVEGLSQDMQLLQEKQKGAGAILSSLIQDKICLMQKLTDSYFSWTDEALFLRERLQGKSLKEDVISEFRSTLRSLRNDEYFIPSLEKTLDINNQNLMSRLRATFSGASDHKMKDMDFKLLTLFFAGFTPKSISFIMDMTEESVRTRKSRYKKLFQSMEGAGEEFISHLA